MPAAAPALPLPTPRVEVLQPSFGEVVEAVGARRYEIRVDVTSFVLTERGQGAFVALDGGRPRRWPPDGRLRLGDLLPEDAELTPGAHVLFVGLADGDGRFLRGRAANGQAPFAVVDFFVGARAELPGSEPRLFCLSPVGTFYGPETHALRLELFPTGPIASPTRVRFSGGSLEHTAELDPSRPYLVEGLPAGDVTISASAGPSTASCVATLNPMFPRRGG